MDAQQKAQYLANAFSMAESVCSAVLKENGGDLDKACDHLLTIQNQESFEMSVRGSAEEAQQLKVLDLEASTLQELRMKEQAKQKEDQERLAKEKRIAAAKQFLEEKRREREAKLAKDVQMQQPQPQLQPDYAVQTSQLQRESIWEQERKEREERRKQAEAERARRMEIEKAEEERWRRELAKQAEEKRNEEIKQEKARRRREELEQKEEERRRAEEAQREEELLKRQEEERKRIAEEALELARQERERLAAVTRRTEQEIEIARREAEREALKAKQLQEELQRLYQQQPHQHNIPFPQDADVEQKLFQLQHHQQQTQEANLKAKNLQATIEQSFALTEQSLALTVEDFVIGGDDLDLDSFGVIDATPEPNAPMNEQVPLPLFAIFTDSNIAAPTEADTSVIEQILSSVGVNNSDIRKVDLASDFELAGWIKAQCNGDFKFPLVFMRKQRIGGLDELQQMVQTGELQKLISSDHTGRKSESDDDSAPAAPHLGVLDRALERVETVVSYFNPLGWIRWGSKGSATETASDTVEFDVIHTNWYWRHLRRKLRFCSTVFLRLHPKHGDVRSAHNYSDLACVNVKGTDMIVFNYTTGASPDWITCSPRDLVEILTIIRKRAPNVTIEEPTATSSSNGL